MTANRGDDAAYLTPAELNDLRIIRGRAMMDRGDIRPMEYVTWSSAGTVGTTERTARVIPWLEALNMSVD